MKKKETILVIIMGILTVVVIALGFNYNKNRKAALLDRDYEAVSQTASFEERKLKKEEEKRAKFLAAFDENRKESTVADFLQYVKYGKGDTAITFFGEVEDQAQWLVENMDALAAERAFSEMKLEFVSMLDSEEVWELKVPEIIEAEPDVVFFHVPLPVNGIVDWTWDGLPIEENNIQDTFAAYDAMKDELTEALIVIVTPVPESSLDTEDGAVTSAHQEGIVELLEMSNSYSLPVFNLHDQVMAHLAENELSIESLYAEDGVLTAEAQQMISTLFAKNMRELKVDTTSAYYLDGEPAEIDIVLEDYDLEEEESSEEEISEESIEEDVIEDEWSEEEVEVPDWTAPESEVPSSDVPPADEGTTTPPSNDGLTTPPANDGTTTPPSNDGSTTPPANDGSTTPPSNDGSTTPPADDGSTTPPADGGSTTPPADDGSTTPPTNGGSTTPPEPPLDEDNDSEPNLEIPEEPVESD